MKYDILTKKERQEMEDENYLAEIGDKIAKILNIKKNKTRRYTTAYGDKTNIGLARTIQRLAIAIDAKESLDI